MCCGLLFFQFFVVPKLGIYHVSMNKFMGIILGVRRSVARYAYQFRINRVVVLGGWGDIING